jgi:hypothetical protein
LCHFCFAGIHFQGGKGESKPSGRQRKISGSKKFRAALGAAGRGRTWVALAFKIEHKSSHIDDPEN